MGKLKQPETIKVRIKKNQRRASVVGFLYWVCTLALLVLCIFPFVGNFTGYSTDEHVWVVSFLAPILAMTKASSLTASVLLNAVASIFYALLLVVALINFIISTTRLFRITKKNPTNKWGYNRASKAMKTMGKAFSRLFFWAVAVTFGVLLLGDGSFTLFFYIALAVGLLGHYVGNFAGCKVSFFKMTEDRFQPIEMKRTEGRKISLLRNTWQFVSIFLIVILMDKFGLMLGSVFKLAETGAMATIMANNLLDGLVIPVILLLILVCLLVCLRHATGMTEYNEYGAKARGMKTCRIFGTAIAVLALIGAVVVLLVPAGTVVPKWAFFAIFAIAFQWVGAENMFLELSKKQEETEEKEEEKPAKEKKEKKAKKSKPEKVKKEKTKKSKKDEPAEEVEEPESKTLFIEDAVEAGENVETDEDDDEIVEETDVEEPTLVAVDEKAEEGVAPDEAASVEEETPTETVEEISETAETPETLTEENNDVVAIVATEENGETAAVTADEIVEETPTETETEETQAETVEEQPVEEEKAWDDGLTEEERAERLALKNKWIAMANMQPEEEKEVQLLEEQHVLCPTCGKKLSVKFGTDVAKCPACETMFVLRKIKQEEPQFMPEEQAEEDYIAEDETSLEEQYLAEAEAELRKYLESDEE